MYSGLKFTLRNRQTLDHTTNAVITNAVIANAVIRHHSLVTTHGKHTQIVLKIDDFVCDWNPHW
jgi:hypothetical protein